MQGLMVVNASTGQPPGGSMGIARWLLDAVLSNICLIGYIWALFDSRNQTLYDKIISLEVVQVPSGGITPIFPGGKPF